MSVVLDVVIILLLFALFGYTHTLLASKKAKENVRSEIPALLPWYRLLYNILAVLIFAAVFFLAPRPDVELYDLPYPWDIVALVFQGAALVGLVWSLTHWEMGEFLGIAQLKRHFNGHYNYESLDEESHLHIKGPYHISRHPVYLFSILFLAFRPVMSLWYLVMLIAIAAYFYIGSIHEERKLVERFGDAYRAYQKEVPRICPFPGRLRKKN